MLVVPVFLTFFGACISIDVIYSLKHLVLEVLLRCSGALSQFFLDPELVDKLSSELLTVHVSKGLSVNRGFDSSLKLN